MDEQLVRLSFDLEECSQLKRHFTGGRPYSDRMSMGFLGRLLELRCKHGEDMFVLSAIDQIEGLPSRCRTKRETQFRGKPLGRFWHKHFATSRHAIRNFGEESGLPRGGNPKLDRLLHEIAQEYGGEPDQWPAKLAHEIVLGGLKRRSSARRMTGDWIIFGKHEDENYYLDLATHAEAREPNQLYEKLSASGEAEFPSLFL